MQLISGSSNSQNQNSHEINMQLSVDQVQLHNKQDAIDPGCK